MTYYQKTVAITSQIFCSINVIVYCYRKDSYTKLRAQDKNKTQQQANFCEADYRKIFLDHPANY